MKKLLATILAALMVFVLVGCGKYAPPEGGGSEPPNGNVTPPEDPDDPDNPDEPQETDFTVRLVYNGQTFQPEAGIYAQWTNGTNIYRAPFGTDGIARTSEPDGAFRVTLSSVPKDYTYNPNLYTATNSRRAVSIEIYKLSNTKGDGDDLYDPIVISAAGTYRATFTSPTQEIHFQYEPRRAGLYSVESIMDTSANEINPFADIYTANKSYKRFMYTQDGGGTSSSFTKNFRFEIAFNQDELGGAFAFTIKLQTRVNNFPCNIDFRLRYEDTYSRDDAEYIPVNVGEHLSAAPTMTGNYRYVAHFTANNVLDGKKVRYNEQTRYYEFCYDTVNGLYKTIYAKLNRDSEILVTESGTGFLDSYIRLRLCGEHGAFKDYYAFMTAYTTYCNSDGCYPVTEELRQFLQDYSVSQRLFMDGNGMAESQDGPGYNSSEADQWMFNCGIYV